MNSFQLRLSQLIPLLVPLAFIDGRPRIFLAQWSPFYLVILLYDCFKGMADNLIARVDYTSLIHWEEVLFFGKIPTIWLQQKLQPLLEGTVGQVLAGFYFGHFILPVVCLYWAWRKNERAFLCCVASLSMLSVTAFFTFYIFPAAPPWLASAEGYLPPVQHLIMQHMEVISSHLPQIYLGMNSNPVAPFPSLHAAYPILLLLCGLKYFPRRAAIFLWVNAFVVAFTIVSFGEHFVVDVLAGWFYAAGSFYITEQILLPFLLKRRALDFILRPELRQGT